VGDETHVTISLVEQLGRVVKATTSASIC